jgi:hypothetical protein
MVNSLLLVQFLANLRAFFLPEMQIHAPRWHHAISGLRLSNSPLDHGI